MRRALAVLVVVAAAIAGVSASASAGASARADHAGNDNPLDDARRASQTVAFTGVVAVHWRDAGGDHDDRVAVESADGRLTVVGANALLWPSIVLPSAHPDPSVKYLLVTSNGPDVAGRSTRVVDVVRAGRVRERLFLDHATDLLMRREQFDTAGAFVRAITFVELREGNDRGLAKQHPATVMRAPSPAKARAVAAVAPSTLRDGYQRVGVYRQSGVVHVLYSDGLYQLSLFEQPGRLDRSRIPGGGAAVALGARRGWRYRWAGGDVLLWQAGRVVYTLVGDGPIEELAEVAASVPTARRPSVVGRLRTACRTLLDGF